MTNINPVFLVRRAKKQSGQPDAVLWCSEDYETANATLDYLLLKSGRKFKDYYKAVATNFPVVNELPPEGEISFSFCELYQLGKDKMTWEQIPGVSLPAHPATQKTEMAEATVIDGVDTSTGEIVDEQAFNEADAVTQTNSDLKIDEGDDENTRYPIVQMSFRKQLLSQLMSDALRYHLTQSEYHEITRLEMDTDNGYVQNLLLAAASVEKIQTLDMPFLWKYTKAVRDVFDMEKRHELSLVLKFTQVWAKTSHIDRGLLVKEWLKGNRVIEINRTPSGANAGGGIKSDRLTPLTPTALAYEIALGLKARTNEFDIYNPPIEVDIAANAIMNMSPGVDKDTLNEFQATLDLFNDMPGGMDYSRACNVATVKTTPADYWRDRVKHREYLNRVMTETDHAHPDELIVDIACGRSSMPMPMSEATSPSREDVDRQLAAGRGEFVPGISDPDDPKWEKTPRKTFSTHEENLQRVREEGARKRAAAGEEKSETDDQTLVKEETTSNVQVQNNHDNEEPTGDALSQSENAMQSGESGACTGEETTAVEKSVAEILASAAPSLANQNLSDVNQNTGSDNQNSDSVSHTEPEAHQIAPEQNLDEPEQTWPTYFEPGRYEGVPNDVYHAANGISSTMVKDARVSLMYYERRHVSKTIKKERSKVLDMGNLVHAVALQPEILEEEFSIEPAIPEGALTTTATIRAVIDEYNASLPPLLSADDIKVLLEEYNATLPAQLQLGASLEETAQSYMALPAEYQRIEADQKQTAAAMKACIKEYNATLPTPVKTSGSRDALLEQLAIINPDLVAQEVQKPQPLKVSGTKADLIQALKSVKPDAVFADELLDAWRENPGEKILVTRQQYETALAIQSALYAHPEAGMLLSNPTRSVEVSYFGIDEETGLEIRTRPDVEIEYEGLRIGFDLKTISMWDVKENQLKARLHREITMRDYHLSAGMYCENASLDKFAWIFVNKDEGYHWVAVVWAHSALLELGTLEYRQTMRAIANAMDTGEWPAPITEEYTDELNEYDLRRLDALREMA